MKKVLVTGAAGGIGMDVIKYLLSEGKYEITAVDLKNKKNIQKLKKYKKRINIVYGDVTDRILIEALIKDHDIVLHLAGVLPPLANLKKDLAWEIDYKGCENIARAISYYNTKCHLFYASTTSLYRGNDNATVKSQIKLDKCDYYNKAKYASEKIIKEKIKNYTIFRLPLVLSNIAKDDFSIDGKMNEEIEFITKEDAAYAFVKGIDKKASLNKKTFNLSSGKPIKYKELIIKYLENYGYSWKFLINRLFAEGNFYNSVCKDRDELNEIIDYRNDSIDAYYKRMKNVGKKRKISKFLAKPIIKVLKK